MEYLHTDYFKQIKKLDKYKQNLSIIGPYVWSYASPVALIQDDKLIVQRGFKNYSKTTTKHINYVAKEFNLSIVYLSALNKAF